MGLTGPRNTIIDPKGSNENKKNKINVIKIRQTIDI